MITALTKLYKGDQVFDSYGRKDNRRLFFCYGFVEDDNQDGNGCSPNTGPGGRAAAPHDLAGWPA